MAGYTSIADMFDGGGPGQSGSTFSGGPLSGALNAVGVKPMGSSSSSSGSSSSGLNTSSSSSSSSSGSVAPQARPTVLTTGTGTNKQFIDTSTGQAYAAPTYSAFSFRGLTSTDPANVLRNRAAAARYAAAAAARPVSESSGYLNTLNRDAQNDTENPRPVDGVDSGNAMSGEEVSRMNAERSRVPTYEAGGYVGKDGKPIRPSTGSMDLPPSLARLLGMPMQSYAEGGMVGPGGMPQRPMASPMAMDLVARGGAPVVGIAPPGQTGRPLNFAAIDQQAQQFMQQNPQQVQQIRAEVERAMAEGEVDAQSLNMFVQIATTALQNPEMWPQLRQVLLRQGMLDAEDIGEEYDQGFLIVLYIIGKSMGNMGMPAAPAAPGQGPAPMSAGQPTEMSMKAGGPLPAKSKNPDGSIPINAHEGEYVIPADVTRRLGTDHFDKLIAKARGADGKGEQ